MKNRILAVLVATAVLASSALALQKLGILNPGMKATAGSFDAPAAKLGKKPASAWSATTVAAAPGGKPLKGKIISVTGEIVDLSCYLQVGKHGDKHRDCGQKCLRAGQPIGLVSADGNIFLLMEEEHNPRRDGLTNFRAAAIENMAKIVTVTGTSSKVKGQRTLYVTGYMKRK